MQVSFFDYDKIYFVVKHLSRTVSRSTNTHPECHANRNFDSLRYLAEATVWISIARILAAFNISKAVNEKGQLIEISEDFTSGLLWYVAPLLWR